jgi:hypothetical protein
MKGAEGQAMVTGPQGVLGDPLMTGTAQANEHVGLKPRGRTLRAVDNFVDVRSLDRAAFEPRFAPWHLTQLFDPQIFAQVDLFSPLL